jgi:hypothetical protein
MIAGGNHTSTRCPRPTVLTNINYNFAAHLPVLWEIWTAEWEIHKLFTQNDIFPLAFSGQFGYDMLALRDKEC